MTTDNSKALDGGAAHAALADLPDLICICLDDEVQWINAAGLRLLNAQDHADVVGQSFTSYLGDDYAALGEQLYPLLLEETEPIRLKIRGRDNVPCDCELRIISHLKGVDDEVGGRYVLHVRNISNFTRIAETLHRRENYLRDLINNSLSLICECRNGVIRFINQAGVSMLAAKSESDLIGTRIESLFHRSYNDVFSAEFQAVLNEENFIPMRLKRMDGSYVDVDVAFTAMGAGHRSNFLAEAHDITEHNRAVGDLRESIETLEVRVEERTATLQKEIATRMAAEKQLRHLATHDVLTGLPNRSLLRDRIDSAIAGAERREHRVALMFVDLDGFKGVNDRLGHDVGDQLLVWISGVLEECVRATDTVARVGGDEFVLVITDVGDRESISTVAGKVIEKVSEPATIAGGSVGVGASIGIGIYPDDSTDAEGLMGQADAAMYDVKKSGKNNFRFFSDIADG